jgi:hypothetical protein
MLKSPKTFRCRHHNHNIDNDDERYHCNDVIVMLIPNLEKLWAARGGNNDEHLWKNWHIFGTRPQLKYLIFEFKIFMITPPNYIMRVFLE